MQPWLRGQTHILLFNKMKTVWGIASPRSLKKNSSVLEFPFEKIREMQGNRFPNNIRSCSILLGSSKDSQISALKERRQSLIKKGKIPTGDWSFDDRRRRRTLRCRSGHFFSRSSLGRHWRTVEVLKLSNEEEWRRKKKKSQVLWKIQREMMTFSPSRTGFYRPMIAWNDASKRVQTVVSN